MAIVTLLCWLLLLDFDCVWCTYYIVVGAELIVLPCVILQWVMLAPWSSSLRWQVVLDT